MMLVCGMNYLLMRANQDSEITDQISNKNFFMIDPGDHYLSAGQMI